MTGHAPPFDVQIVLDCSEAHAQADFWAAALGFEVEIDEEQVRALLDRGVATEDDVATHDGKLVWRGAAAIRDPDGLRPRWFFQDVPEPRTTKNRMHVDVRVGADRRADEVARLEGLGATQLYDGRLGTDTWVTMADPEGNEFCVT
ncbi:MAG: VOC family protein [Acidimicrobiia bacterium]|nr:VOC family protein [Acidimicrobiia bacterium]